MKRIRYYFLFLPFVLNAQSYPPPSSLITLPTAGTLQRGSFALEMRIQKFGGLTSSISVGLTDRFQLGISYGSANLIGDDSLLVQLQDITNLEVKFKIIGQEGNLTMPITRVKNIMSKYGERIYP